MIIVEAPLKNGPNKPYDKPKLDEKLADVNIESP